MSDDKNDKARKGDAPAPSPKGVSVVALILTALVSAGAAGGASLYVSKRTAHPAPAGHAAQAAAHAPAAHAPPGFTLALDPFVLMSADSHRAFHAMRTTLALEFSPATREDDVRPYVARIRDAALSLLRSISYEVASDPAQMDHIRAELQTRFQATGVRGIARVLITDLVVQ